jgi:hypothetical protein
MGGLGVLLVLRDLADHVKPRRVGAPGVLKEALRPIALDLEQVILGFIDELTNCAIVGHANGSFDGNELLEKDSAIHETRPSGFYGFVIEEASLPGKSSP